MNGFDLINRKEKYFNYKLMEGGNVPGGHYCLYDGVRKPFITPMRECNSIPLENYDTVVDIGAYVGTYAIRCARFPVKKVIAFEPTPESFNILKMNKANLPNIEIRQEAVIGDNRKEINFYISHGIGVTNSGILSKNKDKITVKATNYLDIIKEATIVKIDIEGGEYDLPIVQDNLRAIIIDFHPIPGNWIEKAEKIIYNIEKAGFKSVIYPDWSNGWTRAGSWIRGIKIKDKSVCEELINGEKCCGCGKKINSKFKGLCKSCYNLWKPKYRKDFILGE